MTLEYKGKRLKSEVKCLSTSQNLIFEEGWIEENHRPRKGICVEVVKIHQEKISNQGLRDLDIAIKLGNL